jgi:sugar phosphate isomerase/epimerase
MKLSFTTLGCPGWTIDQIIENGRAYGYDGVELRTHVDGNHLSPNAAPAEARALGDRFRDGGIPISSIMGYSHFSAGDPANVAANAELLGRLVDLAAATGAPYVRTFAGQLPKGVHHAQVAETMAKAIRPVALRAADQGVRIGLETHDDWCSGELVMSVVDRVASRGFGVVYDIYNSILSGIEPWEATYLRVRDHICYCHLKDGYAGRDGKGTYVLVGAGDLPFEPVLRRLKQDGFDSFISFEWEKKWHPELEEPERALPHYVHKVRKVWASL